MVVMKFGGTSVKDPDAIRRLARIVAREQGISGVPVVVVSAMSGITDQLLDASQNYDYRPIMSFSGSQKWLHGYSDTDRAEVVPAYRSVSASSNARSTGFSR